jgi:hypothetical protein
MGSVGVRKRQRSLIEIKSLCSTLVIELEFWESIDRESLGSCTVCNVRRATLRDKFGEKL